MAAASLASHLAYPAHYLFSISSLIAAIPGLHTQQISFLEGIFLTALPFAVMPNCALFYSPLICCTKSLNLRVLQRGGGRGREEQMFPFPLDYNLVSWDVCVCVCVCVLCVKWVTVSLLLVTGG